MFIDPVDTLRLQTTFPADLARQLTEPPHPKGKTGLLPVTCRAMTKVRGTTHGEPPRMGWARVRCPGRRPTSRPRAPPAPGETCGLSGHPRPPPYQHGKPDGGAKRVQLRGASPAPSASTLSKG